MRKLYHLVGVFKNPMGFKKINSIFYISKQKVVSIMSTGKHLLVIT